LINRRFPRVASRRPARGPPTPQPSAHDGLQATGIIEPSTCSVFEAQLDERRCKAVDPDNRVIARTLERGDYRAAGAVYPVLDGRRRSERPHLPSTGRKEAVPAPSSTQYWTEGGGPSALIFPVLDGRRRSQRPSTQYWTEGGGPSALIYPGSGGFRKVDRSCLPGRGSNRALASDGFTLHAATRAGALDAAARGAPLQPLTRGRPLSRAGVRLDQCVSFGPEGRALPPSGASPPPHRSAFR
jgi:hypothetical protein